MADTTVPYNETNEALELIAEGFLTRQSWCRRITAMQFMLEVVDFFNLYLAHFEPIGEAPSPVWIIVGDTFPAFVFDTPEDAREGPLKFGDHCSTEAEVLEVYADKLEEWAAAFNRGERDLSSYMPIMYRNATRELSPSADVAGLARGLAADVRDFIRVGLGPDSMQ